MIVSEGIEGGTGWVTLWPLTVVNTMMAAPVIVFLHVMYVVLVKYE